MERIRIRKLLHILNRYAFTSQKLYFMENICKLKDFTKQDFDDVLEYFGINPYEYMTKSSKRQAIIDYYKYSDEL